MAARCALGASKGAPGPTLSEATIGCGPSTDGAHVVARHTHCTPAFVYVVAVDDSRHVEVHKPGKLENAWLRCIKEGATWRAHAAGAILRSPAVYRQFVADTQVPPDLAEVSYPPLVRTLAEPPAQRDGASDSGAGDREEPADERRRRSPQSSSSDE